MEGQKIPVQAGHRVIPTPPLEDRQVQQSQALLQTLLLAGGLGQGQGCNTLMGTA